MKLRKICKRCTVFVLSDIVISIVLLNIQDANKNQIVKKEAIKILP